MSQAAAQKVLVTGPPANGLAAYFKKLASMQEKHSFSIVLAQDLFKGIAEDDEDLAKLLSGEINVPVQVYAGQGKDRLPSKVAERVNKGEEVTTNLSVLPKSGVLTLSSGLRLATLTGGSSSSSNPITPSDITVLTSSVAPAAPGGPNSSLPAPPPKPADILLTTLCPSSLPLQSTKSLSLSEGKTAEEVYSPELDEAAKAARAKYHFFSEAGVFWEREPFVWPALSGAGAGEQRTFCRALGLGEMGNKNKERAFYAFSITPSVSPAAPTAYTPSPFHPHQTTSSIALTQKINGPAGGPKGLKRPAPVDTEEVNEMGVPSYIFAGVDNGGMRDGDRRKKGKGEGGPPPEHYTCHLCQQKGHWIQDCPEKEARDREREEQRALRMQNGGGMASQKPISPDECWFCLSNPKVTKHLIASIGSETYLTLPKGQVCSTDSSPVPGGGHVMIIPISHYPTLRSIPSDLAPPVLDEIQLYKESLRKCYAKHGADMVSFEVGRAGGKGGHAHVQVCWPAFTPPALPFLPRAHEGIGASLQHAYAFTPPSQICPIPSSLSSEALSTFESQASKYAYDLVDIPDLSAFYASAAEDDHAGSDYFKVDLPGGVSKVHWIEKGKGFSLQFGRECLALLLHAPDRVDWKKCVKDAGEEKKDTQRFKQAFKEFDVVA
ncbi:hypothetical protein JCM11251_005160 [Rhodosporidiobolus azoricus]